MKKLATAVAASLVFSLAACGSTDDASTEAEADTVEIPANDAMDGVEESPVEDPDAALEAATAEAEANAAALAADAESAGDAAANVAAQVEAAAADTE